MAENQNPLETLNSEMMNSVQPGTTNVQGDNAQIASLRRSIEELTAMMAEVAASNRASRRSSSRSSRNGSAEGFRRTQSRRETGDDVLLRVAERLARNYGTSSAQYEQQTRILSALCKQVEKIGGDWANDSALQTEILRNVASDLKQSANKKERDLYGLQNTTTTSSVSDGPEAAKKRVVDNFKGSIYNIFKKAKPEIFAGRDLSEDKDVYLNRIANEQRQIDSMRAVAGDTAALTAKLEELAATVRRLNSVAAEGGASRASGETRGRETGAGAGAGSFESSESMPFSANSGVSNRAAGAGGESVFEMPESQINIGAGSGLPEAGLQSAESFLGDVAGEIIGAGGGDIRSILSSALGGGSGAGGDIRSILSSALGGGSGAGGSIGNMLSSALGGSGSSVASGAGGALGGATAGAGGVLPSAVTGAGGSLGSVGNLTAGGGGEMASILRSGFSNMGASIVGSAGGTTSAVMSGFGSTNPQLLLIQIAIMAVGKIVEKVGEVVGAGMEVIGAVLDTALDPLLAVIDPVTSLLSSFANMIKMFGGAAQRDQQKKYRELAQKRLSEDVKSIVEQPFKVLSEAVGSLTSAWDSQLRVITATQGYDKAGMQELIEGFSERIQAEGLERVVDAASLTEQFGSVLTSGLQGVVAEEFAVISTILKAAFPTVELNQLSSVYGSIYANAVRAGESQESALELANSNLEAFAGQLAYAGREIAGGVVPGLQDAVSLFSSATKIAQTAGVSTSSELTGVLTRISAAAGAIAPDLASGLMNAIEKAAIDGNSDQLIALRSMSSSGGASNTEFLKRLLEDPAKILGEVLGGLSELQQVSSNAYMEAAENLSSIFNLSISDFARLDFGYLKQAAEAADKGAEAYQQSLELLKSGETTTNAQSAKMAEINKRIMDEGLSYVLDNEVARQIQQHMWDEQLQRELIASEFSVSLAGESLNALMAIWDLVKSIVNIGSPFALVANIVGKLKMRFDATGQQANVGIILDAGKVGSGNSSELSKLLQRNVNHNVVDTYASMITDGAISTFRSSGATGFFSIADDVVGAGLNAVLDFVLDKTLASGSSISSNSLLGAGVKSQYAWDVLKNGIGARGLANTKKGAFSEIPSNTAEDLEQAAAEKAFDSINKMIEDASKFETYDEWTKSAKSYGIKDLDKAMDSAGVTEQQMQQQFNAAQEENQRKLGEEQKRLEDEYRRKSLIQLELINQSISASTSILVRAINGDDLKVVNRQIIEDKKESRLEEFMKMLFGKDLLSENEDEKIQAAMAEIAATYEPSITVTDVISHYGTKIFDSLSYYGTEILGSLSHYGTKIFDSLSYYGAEILSSLSDRTIGTLALMTEVKGEIIALPEKLIAAYTTWYTSQFDMRLEKDKELRTIQNELQSISDDRNKKSDDAMVALIEGFTGMKDLTDPQKQIPVMLAEIVKILMGIAVRQDTTGALSDTYKSLSLNLY